MRFALTIFLLSAIWCAAEVPPSQTIRAEWNYANPVGFVFYVKQRIGIATNTIAVVTNSNQVTISNVVPSQYEWSVTASNMWGESDPSVPFITPAKPDSNGVQVVMQTIRPEEAFTFYRVRPDVRVGGPKLP